MALSLMESERKVDEETIKLMHSIWHAYGPSLDNSLSVETAALFGSVERGQVCEAISSRPGETNIDKAQQYDPGILQHAIQNSSISSTQSDFDSRSLHAPNTLGERIVSTAHAPLNHPQNQSAETTAPEKRAVAPRFSAGSTSVKVHGVPTRGRLPVPAKLPVGPPGLDHAIHAALDLLDAEHKVPLLSPPYTARFERSHPGTLGRNKRPSTLVPLQGSINGPERPAAAQLSLFRRQRQRNARKRGRQVGRGAVVSARPSPARPGAGIPAPTPSQARRCRPRPIRLTPGGPKTARRHHPLS